MPQEGTEGEDQHLIERRGGVGRRPVVFLIANAQSLSHFTAWNTQEDSRAEFQVALSMFAITVRA